MQKVTEKNKLIKKIYIMRFYNGNHILFSLQYFEV